MEPAQERRGLPRVPERRRAPLGGWRDHALRRGVLRPDGTQGARAAPLVPGLPRRVDRAGEPHPVPDRLERAVSIARRKGGLVAVQAIDLDGFKAINETFGHEAGDLLLKAAAKRVKESLRESDTTARLGGDGFGVILPVLDGVKGAREAAQRILAALCRPVFLAGDEISLGASIGIALFPADGVSAAELAKNAELTMAEVKKQGKRAFAFCEDAAPGTSERRKAV